MELYFGVMSGNSARSAFCLFESKAQFTPRLVKTRDGENRTREYLALNPMGKVPSLIDGSFHLWESNAINGYVADKHPASKLLPEAAEGRAAVQRWLYFQAGHVSPACIQVFRSTNPHSQAFWGSRFDSAMLETGTKELNRFLPVLEAALDGKQWFEGEFSLADIAFTPHLMMIKDGGFDFSPYPNLRVWYERVTARQSWKDTYELVFAPVMGRVPEGRACA